MVIIVIHSTPLSQMDLPTLISRMVPFPILGVLSVFSNFSNFNRKLC